MNIPILGVKWGLGQYFWHMSLAVIEKYNEIRRRLWMSLMMCVCVCKREFVSLDEEEMKEKKEKQERRRKIEEMETGKGGTEERPKLPVTSETRLSPASVLPYEATEIAPTQNSKVTTRTHTKRKLFSARFSTFGHGCWLL